MILRSRKRTAGSRRTRGQALVEFALVIPLMQTFILGYAIDTNVRHVRTIVGEQQLQRVDSRLVERTWADGERSESAAGRTAATDDEGVLLPGAPARGPSLGPALDDRR